MSTRGFVGLVVDEIEKIAYNHYDSYPESLGNAVLDWASRAAERLEEVRERAAALRVVDAGSAPTAEDAARLAPWTDRTVGGRSTDDWYCLLRGTQGDLDKVLEAGVLVDASEFPLDSLFAEWGYLVDLDSRVFEVYRGFQARSHGFGRFAERRGPRNDGRYFPCALVASWPLEALPSEEEFHAALSRRGEGDDDGD